MAWYSGLVPLLVVPALFLRVRHQRKTATGGVQQQLVSKSSSIFDCQFRGAAYTPQALCTRVNGYHGEREDCGFSKMDRGYLLGSECAKFCTAMRSLIARAPDIPCENIEPALIVMSQPNPFDCKFKNKPYEVKSACEVAKQFKLDKRCSFKRKAWITGPDCEMLCMKVRSAIRKEPQSPCDVIAWHMLTDSYKLVPPEDIQGPPVPEVETLQMELQVNVQFSCNNVWVLVEGDNSEGLNIRMGSEQFHRLMVADLGWDLRCAIVLENSAETQLNGEFLPCARGATCVKSSILHFNSLPTMLRNKFPAATKLFLMFNDHGTKDPGLVLPGDRTLKRSTFLATVNDLVSLPSIESVFVLVDACFSGSMFGDPAIQILSQIGQKEHITMSHGGDNNTGVADLLTQIGSSSGKNVIGFASSIPPLACMESGLRGGLFSWAYMNALDSLLSRYLDSGSDFSFADIIESTWQQLPPLLPIGTEPVTFKYTDPATHVERSHRQPSTVSSRAQTFFPMSFGNMANMSAAEFLCGSSTCHLEFRNPLSSRCEEGANSMKECSALNKLPGSDPRGFAPLTKRCEWSNEYKLCLPWIKAYAYVEKFEGLSKGAKAVVRCSAGLCTSG